MSSSEIGEVRCEHKGEDDEISVSMLINGWGCDKDNSPYCASLFVGDELYLLSVEQTKKLIHLLEITIANKPDRISDEELEQGERELDEFFKQLKEDMGDKE